MKFSIDARDLQAFGQQVKAPSCKHVATSKHGQKQRRLLWTKTHRKLFRCQTNVLIIFGKRSSGINRRETLWLNISTCIYQHNNAKSHKASIPTARLKTIWSTVTTKKSQDYWAALILKMGQDSSSKSPAAGLLGSQMFKTQRKHHPVHVLLRGVTSIKFSQLKHLISFPQSICSRPIPSVDWAAYSLYLSYLFSLHKKTTTFKL